jgi:hypothetical protein
MYGMRKTTVYLPDELKAALEARARSERRSEAELIREAVAERVYGGDGPRPKLPLCSAGLDDPDAAERVDELLRGFGQA